MHVRFVPCLPLIKTGFLRAFPNRKGEPVYRASLRQQFNPAEQVHIDIHVTDTAISSDRNRPSF
jgi:hypothetical protein